MVNRLKSPFFYSVITHAFLVIFILILIVKDEVKKEDVPISISQIISNTEMKKAFHKAVHSLNLPHTEPSDDSLSSSKEVQSENSDSTEDQGAFGGIEATEMQKYFLEISNRINRSKVYPKDAQFNEQEGVVQVLLKISPEGKVISSEIKKGTAFKSLNDAAMSAIQKIGDLPALPLKPSGMPINKPILIHVPIRFHLK
jgi:TonB family protein